MDGRILYKVLFDYRASLISGPRIIINAATNESYKAIKAPSNSRLYKNCYRASFLERAKSTQVPPGAPLGHGGAWARFWAGGYTLTISM